MNLLSALARTFGLLLLGWVSIVLAGCHAGPGVTVSVRADSDNGESFASRVESRDGSGTARFRCLRSSTGACHYVVYIADCADDARCPRKLVQRIELPSGQERQVTGLPAGFAHCVGARMPRPDCRHG